MKNIYKAFESLEKLCIQIDVWIDGEEYTKVKDALNSDQSLDYLDKLFGKQSNTHKQDPNWRKALSGKKNPIPIKKAVRTEFKLDFNFESNKNKDLVKNWSCLFYAKYLRAKILEKGRLDCFTRRLDDVVAYLNRYLPELDKKNAWSVKLTLIYLLELSAASQDWESLGLAERARRLIKDVKYSLDPDKEKDKDRLAPYSFYELLARYNCGVAYFHKGYYRKAVLEFNQIIWQIKRWRENKSNSASKSKRDWKFFQDHNGYKLLYIPAVLFRSEVQLKLQFAYHSICTLNDYLWGIKWKNKDLSSHIKIHAKLIQAQAYQQMGRLDKSWEIFNTRTKQVKQGICKLITQDFTLGQREKGNFPPRGKLNKRFPSLGERFLDILIADHLGWLTLEGEDPNQSLTELAKLVRNGKFEKPNDYLQAIDDSESYLNNIVNGFNTYFKIVQHHAYNRRGYFQQLAKFVAWLVEVIDLKCANQNNANSKEKQDGQKKVAEIIKRLYLANRLHFLKDEEAKGRKVCQYCETKGIDLRRLETEHYKWLTDDMLKFYNSEFLNDKRSYELANIIIKDKKKFIKRLIKLEQKERDDKRIRDLELRYQFYQPGAKELKPKHNETFCWKNIEDRSIFADLLKSCPEISNDGKPLLNYLTPHDYIKIINEWEKRFLHHIMLPSNHEHLQEGFYFMGLQRWNSASPAKGFSVGGGYLLYHYNENKRCVDMGVAIDPGFDFVRNLFHMGFSLDDIDIILISHAHLDHIRDFESIVMLLSEMKKRVKRKKRVHVLLSLGAYKRLEHIIEDPGFRYFIESYIIDVEREIKDDYFEKGMPQIWFESASNGTTQENSNRTDRIKVMLDKNRQGYCPSVKIETKPAFHDDKTYSDSFGFIIELIEWKRPKESKSEYKTIKVGYTGDTRWVYPDMADPLERDERHIEDIAKQYLTCDVLLIHLGSLINKDESDSFSFSQYDQCGNKNKDNKYRCEKLIREKDHPYLIGILRLLSSLYEGLPEENKAEPEENKTKPLVLISEFGEELRGNIRTDFVKRLQAIYQNKLTFLPVDVGINVNLGEKVNKQEIGSGCSSKISCIQCNHFVNIEDADFELYGTDHALYCICRTCRSNTPRDVLEQKKQQLYEVGLELVVQENENIIY